jgi:hypothetical protein
MEAALRRAHHWKLLGYQRESTMNQTWQKILLAGTFGLALAACSSTGTGYDNSMGNSNAGVTSSGTSTSSDANTTGGPVGRTPPPVNGSTSNGGVIDDRINGNPDVPGNTR